MLTEKTVAPAGSRADSGSGRGVFARAVGSYVPKLTRTAFEKYGFSAAALITDWAAIAGAELAAFTRPERLKWPRGVEAYGAVDDGAEGRPGATLMLRVDPARALDVQYRAAQIVERINAYFGYRAVADVKIVQGAVEAAVPTRAAKAPVAASGPAADGDGLNAALAKLQAEMRRQKA